MYAWTYDDTAWDSGGVCDTLEKCITQAKDERECFDPDVKFVYIGEFKEYEPYVDIEYVIERMEENAYDAVGEFSEDWLNDMTHEEKKELQKIINKTIVNYLKDKGHMPNFGTVEEYKEYSLGGVNK